MQTSKWTRHGCSEVTKNLQCLGEDRQSTKGSVKPSHSKGKAVVLEERCLRLGCCCIRLTTAILVQQFLIWTSIICISGFHAGFWRHSYGAHSRLTPITSRGFSYFVFTSCHGLSYFDRFVVPFLISRWSLFCMEKWVHFDTLHSSHERSWFLSRTRY